MNEIIDRIADEWDGCIYSDAPGMGDIDIGQAIRRAAAFLIEFRIKERKLLTEKDRIEFALRDAGFDYDRAFAIANGADQPGMNFVGEVSGGVPDVFMALLKVARRVPNFTGSGNEHSCTDVELNDAIESCDEWLAASSPDHVEVGDGVDLLDKYDDAVSELNSDIADGWNENGRRDELYKKVASQRARLVTHLTPRPLVATPANTDFGKRVDAALKNMNEKYETSIGVKLTVTTPAEVTDEIVECSAKAMWDSVPRGAPWSEVHGWAADQWRFLARAALTARCQFYKNEQITEEAALAEWVAAGGHHYGPNVETVAMPLADYVRFRASIASPCAGEHATNGLTDGMKFVGEVGTMPGTSAFTMAAFKASEVPVGTSLFIQEVVKWDHDEFSGIPHSDEPCLGCGGRQCDGNCSGF